MAAMQHAQCRRSVGSRRIGWPCSLLFRRVSSLFARLLEQTAMTTERALDPQRLA